MDQRQVMSGYYAWQSTIYDATRWAFLFDRDTLLDDVRLEQGEMVVEVGCGTGRNLEGIVKRVGAGGRVVAVDCSKPMLERCWDRIRTNGWNNVWLKDQEYGSTPVTGGRADVVILSYSLSMIPSWTRVLDCAWQELRPGGRIGVVDFCMDRYTPVTENFARWMSWNHVLLDRPYRERLSSLFRPTQCVTRKAPAGLWSYYRFVGERGPIEATRFRRRRRPRRRHRATGLPS